MDVPAHVVTPTYIENHIQVQGGTNWDLDRSAVETPVHRLAEPIPVQPHAHVLKTLSADDLFMRIHFSRGGSALPKNIDRYLAMLPHGAVIALRAPELKGHPSAALKRKLVVRAALESRGFLVVSEQRLEFSGAPSSKSANSVELFLVAP